MTDHTRGLTQPGVGGGGLPAEIHFLEFVTAAAIGVRRSIQIGRLQQVSPVQLRQCTLPAHVHTGRVQLIQQRLRTRQLLLCHLRSSAHALEVGCPRQRMGLSPARRPIGQVTGVIADQCVGCCAAGEVSRPLIVAAETVHGSINLCKVALGRCAFPSTLQIAALMAQGKERILLPAARQCGRLSFQIVAVEVGVPLTDLFLFGPLLLESLCAILAQQFMHLIVAAVDRLQQRLLHQRGHRGERNAGHLSGRSTREFAAEDGQALQRVLLVLCQHVPGTVKEHTHAAMARRHILMQRAENIQPAPDFAGNLGTCQHL